MIEQTPGNPIGYRYEHDGMIHDRDHPAPVVTSGARWPLTHRQEPWTETALYAANRSLDDQDVDGSTPPYGER